MKGFAVRITSTGFKSYIVEKKIGGKTYRRVIGATNIYSNEAARIEGQRLLLELSQGKDPKDFEGRTRITINHSVENI